LDHSTHLLFRTILQAEDDERSGWIEDKTDVEGGDTDGDDDEVVEEEAGVGRVHTRIPDKGTPNMVLDRLGLQVHHHHHLLLLLLLDLVDLVGLLPARTWWQGKGCDCTEAGTSMPPYEPAHVAGVDTVADGSSVQLRRDPTKKVPVQKSKGDDETR
jgi:hypothetical protein